MYPTLFSIGPLSISSFGVFLSIAFVVYSFVVWKSMRDAGYGDDKIFDSILTSVVCAFVGSRLIFVATHMSLFMPNFLRMFLVWSYPGLSVWGALLTATVVISLYTLKQKLRLAEVFDAYGKALPFGMFFIALGIFLDGSVKGKTTTWFTGMKEVGQTGLRHPIGLYAACLAFVYIVAIFVLSSVFKTKHTTPKGFYGWLGLSFAGLSQVILALFRTDLLYFEKFSVDLILGTIIFVSPLVPLFIAVHGKEKVVQFILIIKTKLRK